MAFAYGWADQGVVMYSNIVVPLDGSENSERALSHVAELAKATGGRVHLVQVITQSEEMQLMSGAEGSFAASAQYQEMADQLVASRIEQAEAYLAEVRGKLEADGTSVASAVMEGQAAEKIVDYAASENADLIVMGTRGQGGIQRFLLGSVTDRVLRSARIPVLAIPPGD